MATDSASFHPEWSIRSSRPITASCHDADRTGAGPRGGQHLDRGKAQTSAATGLVAHQSIDGAML
jgi:hypothetical protein